MKRLMIATNNRHKAIELRALLPHLEIETLNEHPEIEPAEEDGETFADNARKKAEHVSRLLNVAAIADDSGLCVDALGGGPGVRSARYAKGSDQDRIDKLLGALGGVPDRERRAHFACAIAFAIPGRETTIFE